MIIVDTSSNATGRSSSRVSVPRYLDPFYKTIVNNLLVYDFALKPEIHFRFVICDKFVQGYFNPKESQVSKLVTFRSLFVQTRCQCKKTSEMQRNAI